MINSNYLDTYILLLLCYAFVVLLKKLLSVGVIKRNIDLLVERLKDALEFMPESKMKTAINVIIFGNDLIQCMIEAKTNYFKQLINVQEKERISAFNEQVLKQMKSNKNEKVNPIFSEQSAAIGIIDIFYDRIKRATDSRKYTLLEKLFINISNDMSISNQNEVYRFIKMFDEFTFSEFCLIALFKSKLIDRLEEGNGIFSALSYQRDGHFVIDSEVVSLYAELFELCQYGVVCGYQGNPFNSPDTINPTLVKITTLGSKIYKLFALDSIENSELIRLIGLLNRYLNINSKICQNPKDPSKFVMK